MKSREQFEAYAGIRHAEELQYHTRLFDLLIDGSYRLRWIEREWEVWQAAREICIGEPDVEEWSESLITVQRGWSKEILEAAGLKVKP